MLQITIIIPMGISLEFVSLVSHILPPTTHPILACSCFMLYIFAHHARDSTAVTAHICLVRRARNSFVWFYFFVCSSSAAEAASNAKTSPDELLHMHFARINATESMELFDSCIALFSRLFFFRSQTHHVEIGITNRENSTHDNLHIRHLMIFIEVICLCHVSHHLICDPYLIFCEWNPLEDSSFVWISAAFRFLRLPPFLMTPERLHNRRLRRKQISTLYFAYTGDQRLSFFIAYMFSRLHTCNVVHMHRRIVARHAPIYILLI